MLFYFGVAADIMCHDGEHWENRAAKAETERALSTSKESTQHTQTDHESHSTHH